MSEYEFRQLVASMRAHQKAYFESRTDEELFASKEAERKVDADLERLFNPPLFA